MSQVDLILTTNRIPSFGEFLDVLQIRPTSFAAKIFQDAYDLVFVLSKDLRQEYEKYYCVEYPDFVGYLELACDIYLDPLQLEKAHVLEVRSLAGVLNDAYEDNVIDSVIECIRKLEGINED